MEYVEREDRGHGDVGHNPEKQNTVVAVMSHSLQEMQEKKHLLEFL